MEDFSIFQLAGYGWFDFDRSNALWKIYGGQQALLNQERWIDPSSSSIPFSYLLTAAALGEGLTRHGKKDEANKFYAEARALARTAGLESLLAPVEPTPAAPASRNDSQKGD